MCSECQALQPRPMHQSDMYGDPKPEISAKQCKFCKGKRKHYVPKPEDVPEKLIGLSDEAINALRPLDVDVGPEERSTDNGSEVGNIHYTQFE